VRKRIRLKKILGGRRENLTEVVSEGRTKSQTGRKGGTSYLRQCGIGKVILEDIERPRTQKRAYLKNSRQRQGRG